MKVKGLLRFADVKPGEHDDAGAAKLSKPGRELNRLNLRDAFAGEVCPDPPCAFALL